MTPGRVFYAVLNMGLGHATRSLPLIKSFAEDGWEVFVGSSGRARAFLVGELPQLSHLETPDYAIRYSPSSRWMLTRLAQQIPKVRRQIRRETEFCRAVVDDYGVDLIVSDHCYGMFHSQCPSIFVTHQIFFAMPPGLRLLRKSIAKFNQRYHKHYNVIAIPDVKNGDQGLLSGELSELPKDHERYRFCGPLSSLQWQRCPADIDLLVSISGPEPQRSILEKLVLEQIREIPGKKVVVLGKSDSSAAPIDEESLTIYPHVPREKMQVLLNRAVCVVSRPGYSTLMELAELGKKALFIPTPGQTEQEYLGWQLQEKGLFLSVHQEALQLKRDVDQALRYPGFGRGNYTKDSVAAFFEIVNEL